MRITLHVCATAWYPASGDFPGLLELALEWML